MKPIISALGLGLLFVLGCTPDGDFPDPPIDRKAPCSVDDPDGECDPGETCREGQCVEDALLCSDENPAGLCVNGGESCIDGDCVAQADLCSDANPDGVCATPLACTNGRCATDAPCAPEEPLGFCEAGFGCLNGSCAEAAQLCSAANPSGLCNAGEGCLDGTCVDESALCGPNNDDGLCPTGDVCLSGSCASESDLCSAANPTGLCPVGESCNEGVCGAPDCGCSDEEVCLDGFCRDEELLCGPSTPTGLCPSGFDCLSGTCVDAGAGCSNSNPTGVCPAGQVCNSGSCAALDGSALCDDDNPCTEDFFDADRNACAHAEVAASCSDGNACTTDVCQAGVCESAPIGGCLEPPSVNDVTSPTRIGELTLTGDKPSNAAVVINDQTAVPENPETTWTVTVNLTPGENVFVIFTDDGNTASETIERRVVYDIEAPTLNVTPEGGQFLNGVTVTVGASEPALVYYSTDGSLPTTASPSFLSLKQFRVFDTTEMRFLAVDLAGNQADEVKVVNYEVSSADNRWRFAATLEHQGKIFPGAAFDRLSRVLYIVGGSDGNAPQAGASMFDPANDAWTTLPSMVDARSQLSAVFVDDALFAFGGEKEGNPQNRVERFDGTTWTTMAPMPSTRFSTAAVVANNGVFVLGGEANGGTVVNNVEFYATGSDAWDNERAPMPRARAGFGAVNVDGSIYVVGGRGADGEPVLEVDIYNFSADTWTQGAPMPNPHVHAAVFSRENVGTVDGNLRGVVVAGGRDQSGSGTVLVDEYIIDEDRWVARRPLDQARHSGTGVAVIVPGQADAIDRFGWIVGGQLPSGITDAMVEYDATLDFARRLPDMPSPRFMHTAVAHDERVYLIGGRDFSETKSILMYDPETETYQAMPDMPAFQSGPAGVSIGGRILAIGGADNFGNAVATVSAFDPASRTWTNARAMPTARRDAALAILDGKVWVIGGENNGALQTVEIYNPTTDTWRASIALPDAVTGAHAAVYLGQIFVIGGERSDGILVGTSVQRFNGVQWDSLFFDVQGGNLAGEGRVSHGALVVTGETHVAIVGGVHANGTPDEVIFSYDLANSLVNIPYGVGSNLISGGRDPAATFLNGSIYLFGGSVDGDVGATGSTDAFKLDGRCFDGVQNGLESSAGAFEAFDSGGGCGIKGIGHNNGLGGTHISTTGNSASSSTNARLGCASAIGETCAATGCSFHAPGSNCSTGDFPVWVYCNTTSNLTSLHNTAGNVYNGCTDEVLGQFD